MIPDEIRQFLAEIVLKSEVKKTTPTCEHQTHTQEGSSSRQNFRGNEVSQG